MTSGTRLGQHEILSPLGKGGMGEVYRARDTKLGREVAIKVLPAEVAADAERLGRFEREARVLASLNHPNIATLHGFETEGDTSYLVMELVEGETLADRIARGRIPADDAIQLFLQIAEGLEAAHDKGVIHRDLKPANVVVSAEGRVKVLDFGLAKAMSPDTDPSGDPDLSASPTMTLAATQMGVVLGTAAYMSPEQARGLAVDQRADIWALGACLFETLAGKKAFEGEDASTILASVIKSDPGWERLPAEAPRRLRALLRRCLQKDPRHRLHHIADVRIELEEIQSGDQEEETGTALPTPLSQNPWRRLLAAAALLGVGLLLGMLTVLGVQRLRPEEPKRVERLSMEIPSGALGRGRVGLAISPDGTHVAYATGHAELYLRPLADPQARLVAANAATPVFSPDGRWLAFYAETEARFYKVSLLEGSAPVPLAETGIPIGVSWQLEDSILVGQPLGGGLLRVPADGGATEQLIEGGQPRSPHLLPDKETLLLTVQHAEDEAKTSIVAQNLAGGERQLLIEDGSNARYVASGHLVYVRESELRAVPFDVEDLQVTGPPVVLVEDLAGDPFAHYAVSQDGRLVYGLAREQTREREVLWVDRSGVETPTNVPAGVIRFPDLAPDGERLAMHASDPVTGNNMVYILDLLRGTRTRLTSETGRSAFPMWLPDGEHLIYTELGAGFFRIEADGTGVAERLLESPESISIAFGWSPPKTLLFHVRIGTRRYFAVDLDDGEPQPLLEGTPGIRGMSLSPDGRWLAYSSDESGQLEIYLRPFPDVESSRFQVSTQGGEQPRWSADSRELFYISRARNELLAEHGRLISVPVAQGEEDPLGTPSPLFEFRDSGSAYAAFLGDWYGVTEQGERFVVVRPTTGASQGTVLHVVENWFEELEQRAPSA